MPPKRRVTPQASSAAPTRYSEKLYAALIKAGFDSAYAREAADESVDASVLPEATGPTTGFAPSPSSSPTPVTPPSQQTTPKQSNFPQPGPSRMVHPSIETSILKRALQVEPRTPSPPQVVPPPPKADQIMEPAPAFVPPPPSPPAVIDYKSNPSEFIRQQVITIAQDGKLAELARQVFTVVLANRDKLIQWRTEDSDKSLADLMNIMVDIFKPNPPNPPPPSQTVPPSEAATPAAPRAPEKSPVRKKVKAYAPTPPSKPVHPPPAPAKPKAVALDSRPAPQDAPPVSVGKAKTPRRHATHTTRGLTRKGIYLTPPAGSTCTAATFTPEVINSLNKSLASDLKAKGLELITAHESGGGIFIDTTRTPLTSETGFVLKHVRRLFPAPHGSATIDSIHPTSTSFLKVLDVPITPGPPKEWASLTLEAFLATLKTSSVGKSLADAIKHRPRIMRVSPHSDSCVAWVDIHDSQSGRTAASLIGKHLRIGDVNCRIAGAKPHPGSIVCTRCRRWGHHHSQCRSESMRCPLCAGPHSEANHDSLVKVDLVDKRHCINCTSANRFRPSDKQRSTSHASSDRKCPFWEHRFNRGWLKSQFRTSS